MRSSVRSCAPPRDYLLHLPGVLDRRLTDALRFYAHGFTEAKILAKKMVASLHASSKQILHSDVMCWMQQVVTFTLSSEQLSSQLGLERVKLSKTFHFIYLGSR